MMYVQKLTGTTIISVVVLLTLALPHRAVAFIDGIDVSHWQGNINWTSVKNAGVEFAFTKATEGVDFIDSKYVQNMNGASAADVLIGPYHFARPDSFETNPLDPINEANDFVDAIEPYYQTPGQFLRPVLDVERLPDIGELPQGETQKSFLSQWIRDFNDTVVSRLGFAPIIYANSFYANTYFEPDLAQYDLWLARWTHNTNVPPLPSDTGIWSDWAFWQWTDSWSAGGINPVDGDVFDGTMDDLMQFVVGAVAPLVRGDANNDGQVTGADLIAVQQNFGNAGPADGLLLGDADDNGFVTGADLIVIQESFGNTQTPASTPIPEPASLAILTLIGLGLTVRRNG